MGMGMDMRVWMGMFVRMRVFQGMELVSIRLNCGFERLMPLDALPMRRQLGTQPVQPGLHAQLFTRREPQDRGRIRQ